MQNSSPHHGCSQRHREGNCHCCRDPTWVRNIRQEEVSDLVWVMFPFKRVRIRSPLLLFSLYFLSLTVSLDVHLRKLQTAPTPERSITILTHPVSRLLLLCRKPPFFHRPLGGAFILISKPCTLFPSFGFVLSFCSYWTEVRGQEQVFGCTNHTSVMIGRKTATFITNILFWKLFAFQGPSSSCFYTHFMLILYSNFMNVWKSCFYVYLLIFHFVFYSCLCECMIILHDFK